MKRLLVIFFLFTFLSANTAFGEVLKLPMLVQHYLEHTNEDKDVTIFNFLVQHYTGGINHDHRENHNHHDQLPFKAIDGHFSSVVFIAASPSIVISHNTLVVTVVKLPAYSQQSYSNAYLNSIWQPPRFS